MIAVDAAHPLVTALQESADTLVLTGAGISLASGIPTFRGSDAGAVWASTVMARATLEHFVRDPADTWTWYRERHAQVLAARPNPAHRALVDLERWLTARGGRFQLITQNIDLLHEAAGSRAPTKVHGSIDRARCANPACRESAGTVPAASLDFAAFDARPDAATVPRCHACGDRMRPHVLWFDEHYGSHPDYGWARVLAACDTMRLAIAVGTSFSVGVTDLIAGEARRRGVMLFVIDPEGASVTGRQVVGLRDKAEELLPRVCALVGVTAPDDALLRFYRLEGADARGRMLSDIWSWDATRLEDVHDYIQWLFPLRERSAFNPQAPILTQETIDAFRADTELGERLRRSLTLMLDFYGLTLAPGSGGTPRIERGPEFVAKSRGWLQPGDHNHLRLTRILTSLRLLGLEAHSRALYACLAAIAGDHPQAVSATTLAYWHQATL